jgi:branched-chain amino acid transport system permease protein
MTWIQSLRSWVVRLLLPLVLIAAVPFAVHQSWVMNLAVLSVMYAALASSWNLLGGFTGYISLCHAAFFGIGAYALAKTAGSSAKLSGYGPFAELPLIGIAIALIGIPIGWLVLRTRHVTFAIVTITLLFIVQALAYNLTSVTAGSQGLAVAQAPFPADGFERPFYWALTALLAIAVVAHELVQRSRLGMLLIALREDEQKARGVGVPTQMLKVGVFAVSVGLTAMVGGVWAYYLSFVLPQYAIDPLIMVGMVLMAFLGGKGTLWGPTIGALIVAPGQQYLAYRLGSSQLYLVGYAAIFLVVILLLPRGVIPTLGEKVRLRSAKRHLPAPAPPPIRADDAGPERLEVERLASS